MKILIQFILVTALVLVFGCQSSSNNTPFEKGGGVLFRIMSQPPSSEKAKSLEVLKKRLETYTNGNYELIEKGGNDLEVKLPKQFYTSRYDDLFNSAGNLKISELMTRNEMEPYLNSLNTLSESLHSQGFDNLVDKRMFENNPSCIGMVSAKNINKVEELILEGGVNGIYPKNIKWMFQEIYDVFGGTSIMLYALKTGKENILNLTREQLDEIKLTTDPNIGRKIISIKFNENLTEKWKNLTTQNIKKALVVTLDNKILSAPMVHSPIENGMFSISLEDEKQVEIIAAVLKNESTQESPFKMVGIDYYFVEESKLIALGTKSESVRDYEFVQNKFKNNFSTISGFINSAPQLEQKIKSALISDMQKIIKSDIFEFATKHNLTVQQLRDILKNAKLIIEGSEKGRQIDPSLLELEKLIKELGK